MNAPRYCLHTTISRDIRSLILYACVTWFDEHDSHIADVEYNNLYWLTYLYCMFRQMQLQLHHDIAYVFDITDLTTSISFQACYLQQAYILYRSCKRRLYVLLPIVLNVMYVHSFICVVILLSSLEQMATTNIHSIITTTFYEDDD
jgi:hypothetical protein